MGRYGIWAIAGAVQASRCIFASYAPLPCGDHETAACKLTIMLTRSECRLLTLVRKRTIQWERMGMPRSSTTGFVTGTSFFTYEILPASISSWAIRHALGEWLETSAAEPFCNWRARRAATRTLR